MQKSVVGLSVSLALLSTAVAASEATESRINQLEQQVAILKAQQASQSPLDSFHISGFATVGVGQSSDALGYADYDDDTIQFSADSMAGLQLGFDINDKAQAVVQMTASKDDDWNPEFEWAYVSYEFDNGISALAGRLRAPTFMLSDYLEVGYAYPFARPSEEVYASVPITNLDGFELRIPIELGNATLTLQPFVGESKVNAESKMTEILGLSSELTIDNYTFRASYGVTTVSATDALAFVNDKDSTFLGAGFLWDNGDWLVMSEWTRNEVDGLYPDIDSYYASIAYRYQDFTPYVMYSHLETPDDDERVGSIVAPASVFNAQSSSTSIGLRWDFASSIAVKFDATYTGDFGSTTGGYNTNLTEQYTVKDEGKIEDNQLYSILFDVVF